MRVRTLINTIIVTGVIVSLASGMVLFAQTEQRTAVTIPDQVKTVFQEGMQSREERSDIPFQITQMLYLPAQQNLHAVFFINAKNVDLGFAASTPAAEETAQEEQQPTEAKLVSQNYVFLQFNTLEADVPGELVKELYVPLNLEQDASSYDPEKEEIYTTGYPLPPGNYLLSMAITSRDFLKIGTQYFEFSLPDPLSYTDTLETTPIFFAKKLTQVAGPETVVEIHKDFFAYSILQIEANLERIFSPNENLDIFFFIFGSQANPQAGSDIDVHYEVYKGEELIINFEPQKYTAPLVSQQLPVKRTVLIRTTKGTETTERTERRDLEPGSYTLSIDIKDNISGKTAKKSIDFQIRG
jgi:hypothetical protein